MKPELKQFGTLTQDDFHQAPVWAGVHSLDHGEPWYDDTDEETFRPWIQGTPVDPSQGMFLVRSRITLSDGSQFPGFLTPVPGTGEVKESELGMVQPHLFLSDGRAISFWGGMTGFSLDARREIFSMLGKKPDQVFPLRFAADPGLTLGKQSGRMNGFPLNRRLPASVAYRKRRPLFRILFFGIIGLFLLTFIAFIFVLVLNFIFR
jgi:hypothetical protein